MADLQDLLARLNGQSTGSGASAGNQSAVHRQPSVSSPIFSPSPHGPQPHHASAIISPNTSVANTPAPEQPNMAQPTPQQQSAQLLNLLRFNSQPSVPQQSIPPHRRPVINPQATDAAGAHARQVSASDLVASMMGKTSPAASQHASASATPASIARPEQAPESTENLQDQLLRLLNQPKPSQNESSRSPFSFAASPSTKAPETAVDDVAQDLADAKLEKVPSDPHARPSFSSSPMHVFGSDGGAQSAHFEPHSTARGPKFTYVNPFEKLEAASPRIRTPVHVNSGSPAPKMEILKPKHGLDGSSTIGGDQHTDKSRKLSSGPSGQPHETVAEAVSDLGEQVGQQIDEVLAAAEIETEAEAAKELERLSPEVVKEMEDAIVETAVEIKKELEDDNAALALDQAVGEPIANALKEVASQVAQEGVADNWEIAEAEDSSAKDEDQTVIVYQFPMRAFSSITVENMPQRRVTFRAESVMDIARFKKEFDQIDRSLVSATKAFIVYALVKKGGFKIIQQSNGQYRQVFESHHERIFNIALCAGGEDSNTSLESILGIGVNGSVFWTSLEVGRDDQWSDNLDTQGLVLPPSPSQDDNTSGGQLKTRAKPSSRHPDFFAVGRGKSIHIIWPRVAQEYVRGAKGICQTDKYLKDRSLKILTGKAGKDFTFSEDDTVIVSLDKAGRMRFWDIRPLTQPDLGSPRAPPEQREVSETLLEFHTTSPTAKSWPTSVFFFDKDKPFNKGIALRYVMVGMKQNHSFQLWDLGLGKAVQEINLPHEKESDAICSVAFHPRTGIMAVAHPTRNSIFFVHVSCPRYNLPVSNQANYISRLAAKDKNLPPVNATAIMTSIAEYSFASKGQIRSLHMLNEPAGPPDVDDPSNNALFELYVMHSKGMCTVSVRRSDLGWKKEGEPINPKNAEKEGIISINPLKAPPPPSDDTSTAGGDTPAPKASSERSVRESVKKESSNVSRQSMTPEAAMRASTLAKVESKQDAVRAAIINGGEKSEKKKKKRSTAETTSQTSAAPRAPPSYAQAAQATPLSKSPAPPEKLAPEVSAAPVQEIEAPAWAAKMLGQLGQSSGLSDTKVIEEIVSNEISKAFTRELEGLYKRVDDDRRAMNAANGAKQEAILRLVSSTLTDNVEGVIRKMVEENMRELLLPKLLENTSSNVEKSVSKNLKFLLATQLAKEVPESVGQALKNPQILHAFTETITKKVALSVESTVSASTGSVLNPAIASLTTLIERGVGDQLRQAQTQRQADAVKIGQLTDTVHTLTETIQTMVANQAELQNQVLKLQQHVSQAQSQASSPVATRSPVKPQQKTPEQLETEAITRLMADGNYEQGTMKWLQSNRTSELFNTVFVKCNPAYLSHVSPLLNLSTGAVVTDSLDQNLMERLIWLDCVLKNVDPHDPETHDIVPKIMDVMNQRLTSTYITLNETSPGNQLLRRISALVTKVNELARAVNAHA
ncbi:hypothetical protein K491DRAFT_711978 [Lophiostoma macrostomum CBS 122681]|uniref:EDC4-like protein pdc1 beta-propeller domain-containing protein n=1 Tax=Lophiostoma macrostomum CBS 122681 TaxID=1314788 RepID=A0A6A6TNN4_9PLEO|nr:hypothetical protein K491DRAFT_711978 [Lophiostoma macrostomum CBS 122681]